MLKRVILCIMSILLLFMPTSKVKAEEIDANEIAHNYFQSLCDIVEVEVKEVSTYKLKIGYSYENVDYEKEVEKQLVERGTEVVVGDKGLGYIAKGTKGDNIIGVTFEKTKEQREQEETDVIALVGFLIFVFISILVIAMNGVKGKKS